MFFGAILAYLAQLGDDSFKAHLKEKKKNSAERTKLVKNQVISPPSSFRFILQACDFPRSKSGDDILSRKGKSQKKGGKNTPPPRVMQKCKKEKF